MKKLICILVVLSMLLLPCAYASNNYNAISGCDIQRRGSKGNNVRQIQQALINLGFLSGPVDGSYGPNTESAVRNFQFFNGITQSGVATMFTQAKLYSGIAIPAWDNATSFSPVSGAYGVRNSDGRSWAQNQVTVSFDFVNQDLNNVEAICIYYWLADSRNNLVKMNGYEYWMQWYNGMNIPYNGTKTASLTINMSSSEWRKMDTVRCVVGEIAYTNGSVAVTMNPYGKPYENSNYILMQCQ